MVSFVVSPKDGELVTASRSSRIRVWNQSTGNVIREFKGPSGLVNVMAVDTTGTLLATGCADRVVTVSALSRVSSVIYLLYNNR